MSDSWVLYMLFNGRRLVLSIRVLTGTIALVSPATNSQPWLIGIMSFHVILWALIIAVRHNNTAQMVLLTAICALVYSTQYVNGFAATHWRALGFTQNYFDPHGVFFSFVFSGPLLLLALFQVGVERGLCSHVLFL